MMEIGFVSFNQEALNRANKVMKLLLGQGAIDELGLGRIRDAFSNMMFPGLSVLQTRAKYFCLLPALYSFLERTRIADAREARKKTLDHEIALTWRLLGKSDKNADTAIDESVRKETGIIGAESLLQKRGYVKYDPTYVYMAGLETYGLVNSAGNIYATIAERSAAYSRMPKKHSGSEDSADDSGEYNTFVPLFKTCAIDYDFGGNGILDIELTSEEANFLKSQIINHTAGSLLNYLLDSGLYEEATEKPVKFDGLGKILEGRVPTDIWETYILARRYSRFADLLRTYYAYLYNVAVGADGGAKEELICFNEKLTEYPEEFTPEAVEQIIRIVNARVPDDRCKEFCRKAAKFIASGDYGNLGEEIVRRERFIKSDRRSKLLNPREYEQGKRFAKAAPMMFRWDTIGFTVLNDIKKGINREEQTNA